MPDVPPVQGNPSKVTNKREWSPKGFWESMIKFLSEQNPEEEPGKLREMAETALDKDSLL